MPEEDRGRGGPGKTPGQRAPEMGSVLRSADGTDTSKRKAHEMKEKETRGGMGNE